MEKNALFFGNGLNQCQSSGPSWNKLLQSIADEYQIEYLPGAPMALEFERMANDVLAKTKKPSYQIYEKIKAKIAAGLLQSAPAPIHRWFIRLPVNTILTTNYDYTLEAALTPRFRETMRSPNTQESKYSLKRRLDVEGKHFYHVHGEADRPTTLCLGYEHYAGYLEKMRNQLNRKSAKDTHILAQLIQGSRPPSGQWTELFFTHNIYIVGFGLDQSEMDLWWLLTYRAYLYYANYLGMKQHITNTIWFYDIYKKNSPHTQLQKTLEGLHVRYKGIELPRGRYLPAYKLIYEDIKKRV